LKEEVYFSIILPVFNREKRIQKAIESILIQEFANWELIIINDASTDNTKTVLNKFTDPRIRAFHNDKNQERCISRNIGIENAKGKYICFLDSDDYHLPDHLSSLYQFVKNHNEPVAFIFSKSWNETETGVRTERVCPTYSNSDPFNYFLKYTVNPQRWCVHNEIFKYIKFDPNVVICEDMDTSLRIANKGYKILGLDKRTTVYVAATDSFTHGDSRKWEKELYYLKRIFSKKELKGKLPLTEKRRLLSMSHFHLAKKASEIGLFLRLYKHSILSFILYPKGYNGKTNKILAVNLMNSIPLFGRLIKIIKS
jgi:glycosyltransferase involved in cell wall biosynthesis